MVMMFVVTPILLTAIRAGIGTTRPRLIAMVIVGLAVMLMAIPSALKMGALRAARQRGEVEGKDSSLPGSPMLDVVCRLSLAFGGPAIVALLFMPI